MKLPTTNKRAEFGFNMTPMIDVVFLLIIFFLVSSHMAQQEVQLELDLPSANSGHDPTEENRPRVTVNVLENGQVQLAGERVGQQTLARRLSVELKESGNDLEVRVRADRRVPYSAVEPILIACAEARIWNVTFAVTRER